MDTESAEKEKTQAYEIPDPKHSSALYIKKYGPGWGWLFLLGLAVKQIEVVQKDQYIHPLTPIVLIVLFLPIFYAYFKFRKKTYATIVNTYNKMWVKSFKIGFLCQVVFSLSCFLVIAAQAYIFKDHLESSLVKSVDKMRKELPKQINSQTQLYKVDLSEKHVTYRFKITDLTKKEIGPDFIKDINKGKDDICKVKSIKILLDQGALITYAYYDKMEVSIYNLNIDKSTCQ